MLIAVYNNFLFGRMVIMELYETNTDNTCRFVLGKYGEKPLICLGINPSTATDVNDDNTIKAVSATIERNKDKYDGYIMLNVYPLRATNPDDLPNDVNDDYIEENLHHIEAVLKNVPEERRVIWAAWGSLIEKRKYLSGSLKKIVALADEYKCKWVKKDQGKRTFRHPHHPLYLAADEPLKAFEINKYCQDELK